MATPLSDDSRTLFRLLADNNWHSYHQIKGKIAETVPPGRAIRRYQLRLQQSRELRRPVNEVVRTEDEQIRLGAMQCAQVALTSWKGKGIMVRGEGNYKEVRLKPGFQPLGEPDGEAEGEQETGKEAEGVPEVPPGDSEPSEAPAQVPEEVSVPASAPVVDDIPTFELAEVFPEEVDAAMRVASPAEPVEQPAVAQPEEQSQPVTTYEITRCPVCGLGVIDQELHESWHRDMKAVLEAPGSAFLDPETLRTLMEGVMRQGLTRFQAGMRSYLDDRFAEVNHKIVSSAKAQERSSDWF